MANFTDKMRTFCEAKASGAKNVQAALLAGYSAASAKVQGSTLAARSDIRAEIARLKRALKTAPEDDEKADLDPRKMLKEKYESPLDLMLDAMNQPKLPYGLRFEAAKQALPYVNPRVEAKGKKDARKDAAHAITQAPGASKARFAPKAAPTKASNVMEIRKRA